LKSVGRGANLLLNVPPDRNGLIHKNDSAALIGFKNLRNECFANNLIKNSTAFILAGDSIPLKQKIADNKQTSYAEINEVKKEALLIRFKKTEKVNCVVVKESILYGQKVKKFYIEVRTGRQLKNFMATTIGRKRIITFPAMDADDILIYFLDAKGKVRIAEVEAYLINEKLIDK
jgi:alpha-L-fucosidase